MINKLVSAWHMARARRTYIKNRLDLARHHVDRYMERNTSPDPVALAFDATLNVLEHRSTRANEIFKSARLSADMMHGEDAVYVREYCLYYECLISKASDCDRHRRSALSSNASPRIRLWLSLPPEQV